MHVSPYLVEHSQEYADNWHAAGQRNLFNRMLGQLHHCLKNGHLFDELTAFPTPQAPALAVA
ncbi:hypothetical protein [Streptomyces sp. NBC_00876]|uniref:hypothetical protein n=1 Tax=Streptomyces sp. NBC_00876 TaxID=2975853 RepID=UPI00386D67F8